MKTKSVGWWLCTAIWIVAIGYFAAFCITSYLLGGDALNGKVESGRYFLSQNGRLTEVSQSVFEYSRWHARSLFLTFPLAILTVIVAYANGVWVYKRR